MLKPKFNIIMRDDKQYTYVGITDEEFPRPIVTHQVSGPRLTKPFKRLIGPFTDAGSLTTTVRWLRGLFPYCTCKQKHHVKCLNAHIGKCPGYCCLKAPASAAQKTEYRKNLRAVTDILDGRRDALIGRLERRMKALGHAHQLEDAYALQKRIERIRRVFENAQLVAGRRRLAARHPGALTQLTAELGLAGEPARIEGYDVAHIQGEHPSGAMVVFTDGVADRASYRLFNLRSDAVGDTAQLREMLTRRLRHDEWPLPDLILVDGGKAQLNVMVRTLDAHGERIPVVALTKDDRHQADHLLSSLDSRIRMLTDVPRPMRALVGAIDAEAHRFSVGQYRKRHRRGMVE
jgi:excinuclease ABC subunit C